LTQLMIMTFHTMALEQISELCIDFNQSPLLWLEVKG
jgi:hypothetical protein